MEEKIRLLEEGLKTAFIDGNYNSNLAYRPQFVSNDYKTGKKVLSSIENELLSCDEFFISVAFITKGGIAPLLQTLKELENKNIKGKVLTTDYQMFSDPDAIEKIANLKNIELKMYYAENEKEGFHTKGYVFKQGEIYKIITGSSNMTMRALTVNKEWNTKIVSVNNGEYARDILEEFEQLWDSDKASYYEEFIDEYRLRYKLNRQQREIAKQQKVTSIEAYKLQPNSMQIQMLSNFKRIVEEGEKRGLLISATGERGIFVTGRRKPVFTRVLEAWS